ncbi:hypothetical protein GOP47_0013803 [Adiantum capillus-veneris]|uniref:RRM domain-containing protein n=1 Tax=Adiantum capillus-veneris TaxID=13818 RepID=A0A9D4UPP9_ADICA|nr:hypothetical protein GOP47_0013803 [Adiantum capillus-veneris]
MNLDKALDDIIKINKQSTRGGAGGRRGRGGRFRGGRQGGLGSRGGGRTGAFLRPRRPSAYQIAKSFLSRRPDGGWRRDMFEDAVGSALGIETSTKLYISNLDYGVSNEDIKELFSEMGDLKHYGIHYDRSGRSIGTADVVYLRRPDALAAMKRYNNVQLDGKPMKIELIGTNILPPAVRGVYGGAPLGRGRLSTSMRGGGARGRGFGFRRFRGRGGRGRGRRLAEDRKGPTVEDLDADLEKYHKDAMQTS